jgi:serine/threonine protein phosphatase PrpC
MQVAASTHIGGKVRNEDTFCHQIQPNGSLYLGIFDGHGDYGLEVAEAVRDFFKAADPAMNPKGAFTSAEEVARRTIKERVVAKGYTYTEHSDQTITYQDSWMPLIARGGTTASVVHVTGDKLRLSLSLIHI